MWMSKIYKGFFCKRLSLTGGNTNNKSSFWKTWTYIYIKCIVASIKALQVHSLLKSILLPLVASK